MYNSNQQEQEILKYWEDNKIFEKSVENRPEDKPYVFYDGPPFATGLPHYGHLVASLMKDAVPRFWTMRGFRVERKWGWDCHGLPIENIVEKDLKLETKEDIEQHGIESFCTACRSTVLRYAGEWKKTIRRIGRWVDMENAYHTMDLEYMESIWWVFGELYKKGLIYQGYKSMHICPRCVTPLSNFEVTQGYQEVKDLSVTAKFKLIGASERLGLEGDVFALAWTTTPWTLPGNVLLAVGESLDYTVVSVEDHEGLYIVAKERLESLLPDGNYEIKKEFEGSELVGIEYEPLFPYFLETENAFRVVAGDFVSTEEGTGIVHIAPAFGQDDYELGQKEKTGWVQHVTMEGKFTDEVKDFAGLEVKPKEDLMKTDIEILKWLAAQNKLFKKEKVTHTYPFCWRCDTPLLNYATSSWFVKVTDLKDELIKNNQDINWVPEHIKEGRFGKWLEGAKDWAISRNRYWGTPLPVWQCENREGEKPCDNTVVIGSASELEEKTGRKITDLHKNEVDGIAFKCDKCDGQMTRIPEVLDCWFESGSMPYGQMHYPFENKEKFEKGFPAQFIAEGQDQTRGWFYTLHVLAAALTRGDNPSIAGGLTSSFKNVIVNGIVLAEDGKKMSKRLKNYPDPTEMLDKYGADAIRFYLLSSPVMHAESLNFSEKDVREMFNKTVNTLWNVLEFYTPFAGSESSKKIESDNVLDKWIISRLNETTLEVTEKMEGYKLAEACRPLLVFITDLSQWYVRRSRDRFKGEDEVDKQAAVTTLREVLLVLSKVMAPITPFIAEKVYREISKEGESVHLQDWPKADANKINEKVLDDMNRVRKIVEMGLSLRKEAGVKVRQPLENFMIIGESLEAGYLDLVADELNVKKVESADDDLSNGWAVKEDQGIKVALNTVLTDDLKKEGYVREIIRAVNGIRKKQGLTLKDSIRLSYSSQDSAVEELFISFAQEIEKGVLATNIEQEDGLGGESLNLGENTVVLKVEKV